MEPETFLWIAGAVFCSSIFSSIAGFGGGILVIATMSFFFEIKTAVALSSIVFLFGTVNKMIFFHKYIDWIFARNVLIGALPACIVGLYFFNILDPQIIKYIMGLFGVFMILDHVLKLKKCKKIKEFTFLKMVSCGAVFGLASGLSVGPLVKIFILKLRGLSKEFLVGTGIILIAVPNLLKVPVFFKMGLISGKDVLILSPIFLMSFMGIFIGKKILKKISHALFEKIVLVMVGVSVIKFLFF